MIQMKNFDERNKSVKIMKDDSPLILEFTKSQLSEFLKKLENINDTMAKLF